MKNVGGLHFASPELENLWSTFFPKLSFPGPTCVLPMDCSGFKFATKVAREAALGDGHVPAGAAVLVHQILNGAPYKGTSLGTPVFVRNIFVGFVTI
jgi:hypothetical protein